MIPVNSRFASLNLAQAVLLVGYEWMRGNPERSLGRVTTYEKPLHEGLYMGQHDRPATKEELTGLFEHLERELEANGFFNPAHRKTVVAQNLRTLLTRLNATEQEVRTLRGIVATLAQGKGRGRKRGGEGALIWPSFGLSDAKRIGILAICNVADRLGANCVFRNNRNIRKRSGLKRRSWRC
jgi:tRNA/rRNA methyltransferase